MNTIVYKHNISSDKKKREFFLEEQSKKEHFLCKKVRKCTYSIEWHPEIMTTRDLISKLAIMNTKDPSQVKNIELTRRYNSKTKEEIIILHAKGIFYVECDDKVYGIEYEKSIEIYLTPLPADQQKKE